MYWKCFLLKEPDLNVNYLILFIVFKIKLHIFYTNVLLSIIIAIEKSFVQNIIIFAREKNVFNVNVTHSFMLW